MRFCLFALALTLSACELFGPGHVRRAVVTSVRVDRLDIDAPWDRSVLSPGDLPDVYVDVKGLPSSAFDVTGGLVYRSEIAENLDRLPLTVYVGDEAAAFDLADSVRVDVVDRDGAGDDLMFTTGRFTFADHYAGEAPGTPGQVEVASEAGRVVLGVRWE